MIETEDKEEGILEMPDPAAVNLTALLLDERGMALNGAGMGQEPTGRVKDGLLESFLQSNFPDDEEEEVGDVGVCMCREVGNAFAPSPVTRHRTNHHHPKPQNRCRPSPSRSGSRCAPRSSGGRRAAPSR